MRTDHAIYRYLATGPEAFRVLTGGRVLTGPYRFRSLTVKDLERRLDGIYEPRGHDGPVYAIEFQGRPAATAWYNLLSKVGLYGEQHPQRDVQGLLILLHKSHAPAFPSCAGGADSPLTAVYLEQFLPDWLERERDNPFVAVFAPLIIDDEAELIERAPALWRTVQDASLAPAVREGLSQILEYWFFDRFRSLTAEEIWAMLNSLTPLEETRAYQSIFVKGEAKGKVEGKAEGKADGLKRLLGHRFGTLPGWAVERIDGARIEQLNSWLDRIFDATDVEHLIGPESAPRQSEDTRDHCHRT